jgi:hypothetical protein
VGAGPPPETDSASCPSEAEVAAELFRLGAEQGSHPEISFEGDRMRVVLHGRDGATVGSREVEAPARCHERATVAAVLVATWMGIWPEGPKPVGPPPPPVVTQSPPPPVTAPAPTAPGRRTEVGLALTGAHDGNAAAWGVAIEVRRRLVGPWRAGVGLTSTSERDRGVGPAFGGYTRPALEMGPALRFLHGRVQAEIGASARLGIVVLRGKDMPVTYRKMHAAAGMASNLRLVLAGEQFSPFIIATGSYWFGRQQLELDDDVATADLPHWDAGVGLGLLWAP